MYHSIRTKLIGIALVLFAVSLACNAPFGIDIGRPGAGQPNEVVQLETSTFTPTPIPTPTETGTPTETPVPTPTSTLVVPPTSTSTPVTGATQAAAPSGGGTPPPPEEATRVAEAATANPPAPAPQPRPAVAAKVDVIYNGSFEEKWVVGIGIAPGWKTFDNKDGHFSYYDDTWFKVVYDGDHAQLIEIIADGGKGDRYGGIFQTVDVVPQAEYELTIHGLVRSDEGSGEASDYGYAMQYGIDYQGRDDWTLVTEWIDLPFPEHPREDPTSENVYNYGTYTTKIVPAGKKLTLYIRAWKKWANYNEGNWDVDAVSLRGTGVQPTVAPTPVPPTPTPTPGPATPTPTTAPPATPTATPEVMPVSGGELPTGQTPPAILIISLFSIVTLLGGAVVGLVRKRGSVPIEALSQEDGPDSTR